MSSFRRFPEASARGSAVTRQTGVVKLRDDLLDPWGGLVAGVAGGLAWAVASTSAAAVPLGVGVAAAVYGVKVGVGLLTRSAGGDDDADADPGSAPVRAPRRGSLAEQWLRRAGAAVRSLDDLIGSAGASADRSALAPVRAGAGELAGTMRRLAGQVTTVEDALDRVPLTRLADDRARLTLAQQSGGSDRVRAERERALTSVTEQIAVADRLTDARDTLLARMQATALGLEGLVARAAELLALTATSTIDTAPRVDELAADLDGLRTGLAEAEEVTRRVLDA